MGVVIQGPWKLRPRNDVISCNDVMWKSRHETIEHEKAVLAKLVELSEKKRTEFPPTRAPGLPSGYSFQ
jgi:hypothetical protein